MKSILPKGLYYGWSIVAAAMMTDGPSENNQRHFYKRWAELMAIAT